MKNRSTRRRFMKRAALLPTTVTIFANGSWNKVARAAESKIDRAHLGGVRRPSGVRQTDILFDRSSYTAFPHIERLEGEIFRQCEEEERWRELAEVGAALSQSCFDSD